MAASFDVDVDIIVEFGFGVGLFDTTGSWTDVSSRVRSLDISRGRSTELDKVEAGVLVVTLDNSDAAFTANNASSAYYPNVKPMTRVRVKATYNSTTYDLFHGYVESWPPSYPMTGKDAIVQVTAVDAFKVLALSDLEPSFQETVLGYSPVAFWRFDETTGSTASDISTAGTHDITWVNSPTLGAAGRNVVDLGVTLNGSNEYGSPANEADLDSETTFTVVAWVKPGTTSAGLDDGYIISARDATSGNILYAIHYNVDAGRFSIRRGASTLQASGYPANNWYFVVYRRQPNGSLVDDTLFINNTRIATLTGPVPSLSGSWETEIGRRPDGVAGTYFEGTISEIAYFSTALSDAEIGNLYQAQDGYAEELTSARVSALLTDVGVDASDISVSTGKTTMPAQQTLGVSSVLEAIQLAEASENGNFFVAADGTFTFRDRHYRYLSESTSAGTFSEDAADIPYADIVLSYDDTQLWNEAVITNYDDSIIRVRAAASITDYGRRTISKTVAVNDGNELASLGNWLLGLYSEPQLRVTQLSVKPQSDPTTCWPFVLGWDIGKKVTVERTHAGVTTSLDCHIESINHSINPAMRMWETTYTLSPANTNQYWVLGDSSLSVLSSTTRLGY